MTDVPSDQVYVSCAARALYGDLPPADLTPGTCSRAYGIEVIDRLFDGSRYDWHFPADGFVIADEFTDQLVRFYADMSEKRCPPTLLLRIANAKLFKTTIYCSSKSGTAMLYETCRPGDRAEDVMPSDEQWSKLERMRFAGRRWQNLFMGSVGTPNYGHWLIDDLPRLKAVMHLRKADRRPVRLLIHKFNTAIDKIRIESIRLLLGKNVQIEFLDFNQFYHFDELHYVTPVSEHPVQKSPLALSFVARKACESAFEDETRDGRGQRLFVTRSSARGRRLSNQSAVVEIVEAEGFQVVDPETLSFTDQVRLFAGSSAVIGQMGAAMANTLFCPPATTVVHLAPWGWIEPFYWDLAVVRGHFYRALFGAVPDHTGPSHSNDFVIDVDALKRVMSTM